VAARHVFARSCFVRLGLVAVLAALGGVASLINAGSGPPRTLFARLPAEGSAPGVKLDAEMNADGHWILEIETSGFRFTHLCTLAAEPVPIGHAHVYAGDRKLASAYLPVVDLGPLPPGSHEIRVVLRSQDHRVLVGPDGPTEARTVIEALAA
jgi:hypothetical protein